MLSEKEDFYSHLNMEDITDTHYAHAKKVCKDFKIKNSRKYLICLRTLKICILEYMNLIQ